VCETKWISSGIATLKGELGRAESLGTELIRLIEAAHADSGLPGALSNLAYIRFLKGETGAFEEPLARALGVYERMSAAPIDDPRPVLVLLRAMSGRTEDARQLIPGLERLFNFDSGWTASLAEARATLAAALAVLGETDDARRLYEPLKQWTESAGYVLTGASTIPQLVSRVLGMTAAAIGASADADTHFERGIREASELDLSAELAECHYWYGRHLLDRGDREIGLVQLERASEIWQRAAMPQQATRAAALIEGD